jgi:hypothetical protein
MAQIEIVKKTQTTVTLRIAIEPRYPFLQAGTPAFIKGRARPNSSPYLQDPYVSRDPVSYGQMASQRLRTIQGVITTAFAARECTVVVIPTFADAALPKIRRYVEDCLRVATPWTLHAHKEAWVYHFGRDLLRQGNPLRAPEASQLTELGRSCSLHMQDTWRRVGATVREVHERAVFIAPLRAGGTLDDRVEQLVRRSVGTRQIKITW